MKIEVEHEEGIPMARRKAPSLYDQLFPDLIMLTDKKSLFFKTEKAKETLTQFRYWLKAYEQTQKAFNYFAQVGFSTHDRKIGIRIWCYAKTVEQKKPLSTAQQTLKKRVKKNAAKKKAIKHE